MYLNTDKSSLQRVLQVKCFIYETKSIQQMPVRWHVQDLTNIQSSTLSILAMWYEWAHLQYGLWFHKFLAIEIQSMFKLLVEGVVLVIWVRFKHGPSLEPRGVCLTLDGCGGLIWNLRKPAERRAARDSPALEVCSVLWVQESLPHLLVLPGCCLPQHLQLFLYFPGGAKSGKKTRESVSKVQADSVA